MRTRASFRSLSKLTLTDKDRHSEIREEKSLKDTKWFISKDNSKNELSLPLYSFACSNKLKISSVYLILQIHPFKNCFSKLLFHLFSGSASKSSVTQIWYIHITPLKLNRMRWFGNVFKVIFPQES